MIWMISTYSPSSSSSATVWATSRSKCPSTRPKVCHRCSPPSIRSCTLSAKRSEEHTSELQSLMRTSYAVFCLKKKHTCYNNIAHNEHHQPTYNRKSSNKCNVTTDL